jgi:hypothetical protein
VKPADDNYDTPFMTLKVKVSYKFRGPRAYLQTGDNKVLLDEDSIGSLDRVDIAKVDLDISPYDWEFNGRTGRTAYLEGILVVQDYTDRFAD